MPQYARYRAGYPATAVAALAARTGLDATQDVVDVGCGTGQLTLPLARHARSVQAIDPLAAMLDHGRAAAAAAGLDNIRWLEGDATQLRTLVRPGARLATFAASFHWTDRAAALADLDAVLQPGGSVVVVDDDLDDARQPDWVHAITAVRARYPGLEPAPGAVHGSLPTPHLQVLQESAFSDVHVSTWAWSRQLTVDEVVGLQLSYSFSTPALLGDRLGAFCKDVRAAVGALHPAGLVAEPVRLAVLVAARPHHRRAGRRRSGPTSGDF